MQIGIQVVEDHYQKYLEAAVWAEERGLAAFAIPDHYLYPRGDNESQPAHDALAVMAALAAETSTIELVVLVSPVTFRHPAVLAKNYATIQEIADGRLLLGIGTGWMEAEHQRFGIEFPSMSDRYAMLEENLEYLSAAFGSPPQNYSGDRFAFESFDIRPRPPLRLLVGGSGPKRTPRLAGMHAEEFNAYDVPDQDYPAKLAVAREAAAAHGRDPSALRISTSGIVMGGPTDEAAETQARHIAERLGRDPDESVATLRNRQRTTFGTWDDIRGALESFKEDGVERFYMQNVEPFDPVVLGATLDALGL